MLLNIAFLVPALLCWCGAVYCLNFLRSHPNPAVTAILVSFVARGTAFLLGAPRVYGVVDRVVGETNTTRLLINICGIVWSLAVGAAVLYWSRPRADAELTLRRWTAIAGTAVAASIVLWVRANLPESALPETALGFSAAGAHEWSVAALMGIYHLSMTVALVALAVSARRFLHHVRSPLVRGALIATTLGSACYLLFSLNRLLVIGSGLVHGPDLAIEFASPVLTGVGATIMMLGLTAPIWWRHVLWCHTRWSVWRAHRALEPLWRDVVGALPHVALDPAGSRVGDLDFRLYRRRVEICDGLHALGVWHRVASAGTDDEWLTRVGRTYARERRHDVRVGHGWPLER
ncbi:MAB_1171c family putative transporter [Flexivirga meconopsidis]|uniref:MAB_1171c family putative transporter n=1 Tax=Flexivirga meconopsidis TaxID=2977121 RepID=UPI00224077EA|nr:MAB_1171c family putative transporter [Flexivirga meconopsidis]